MLQSYILYQFANYLGTLELTLEISDAGELSVRQSDSGISTQEAFDVPFHSAEVSLCYESSQKLLDVLQTDYSGAASLLRRRLGHICGLETFTDLLDAHNINYVFSSQYASRTLQAF